jgi:hypothetical protein
VQRRVLSRFKRTLGPLALGLLAASALVAWVVGRCESAQLPPPTETARTLEENASQFGKATTFASTASPLTAAGVTIANFEDTPLPEREFLEQLRELNVTDKHAALTLAQKGETWYSATGTLAEARRAMRITLLVDLERMAEARAFTREFIEQYPTSPYRKLVQGVTGVHPRPSGPRP